MSGNENISPSIPSPSTNMSPSPSATLATDGNDDMQDMVVAKRGCCFWIPCSGSSSSSTSTTTRVGWWERMRAPEDKERWWSRGWKRIQEWSEVVAGPKWKTFIRRFHRNNHHHHHHHLRSGSGAHSKAGSFRYDSMSYALNFADDNSALADNGYSGFSSRFGSIPSSAKSSMDLGKDGPSFS